MTVGASSTRTIAGRSQRGPATASEGGNAANRPPMATTAMPAGQRGSVRFGCWDACMFRLVSIARALYAFRNQSWPPQTWDGRVIHAQDEGATNDQTTLFESVSDPASR